MTQTIDILIPVHNNLHLTKQCLPGLTRDIEQANNNTFSYSITVIDDGSKDGTEEWIKNNFSYITLLKGDGNLWWSGGINKGAKHAFLKDQKDFVLLWNNDIIPEAGYFLQLSKIIATLDKETIIGSKICDLNNPDKIWCMGGKFNPVNGHKYMVVNQSKNDPEPPKPLKMDWLTGMGTLIPKEATEVIGYWDENRFPQYFGDTDFTYRAKLAGFKILVYRNLVLYNDTINTGIMHGDKFSQLMKSLVSMRSKYNIKKEWSFYRRYAKSWRAYFPLLIKYFRYIGGFFKWKLLDALGHKKIA
jgi:GT2 family glycosyltransferase